MSARRNTAFTLGFLAALAPIARGQAGLLVPSSTGVPDATVLSLRDMRIDVGIARGYARVEVRQVFENHTGQVQEGTYRFRLPASGTVGDFAVWDGPVRIPGVILEKRRARAIYRELTTQRIDPGLLQQGEEEEGAPGGTPPGGRRPSGGALFSVTVAPIAPWSTKRLELAFQEEVPILHSQAEWRLALAPSDGEPIEAAHLAIRIRLEDADLVPSEGGLPLTPSGGGQAPALRGSSGGDLVFDGRDVTLDRDLIVRMKPRSADPLQLTAFRNPEGKLPDGLALAPWERPTDVPPEKDGFFLLEMLAPEAERAAAPAPGARPSEKRPIELAILFDTSLSRRFAGLEESYAEAVRTLQELGPQDLFLLIPFDSEPAEAGKPAQAKPEIIDAALGALRARSLGPGTDVVAALARARERLSAEGRILLLSDGQSFATSAELARAAGGAPIFTEATGEEVDASLHAASRALLPSVATDAERELFRKRLLDRTPVAVASVGSEGQKEEGYRPPVIPFTVAGPDPKLRDIYPVLIQPPEPGSSSGFIGRYAIPARGLRFDLGSDVLRGGRAELVADLPERALDARDLPRRWARARVFDLLRRIEAEGERREWVEEIIELSRRYKFVTPYTAFLAAPRSLLRPRRIQPGDPVLRVECDASTVSAVALLPWGLRLPLVRRPESNLWEGRFLVPEGLKDGRYGLRVLLRDSSGASVTESKTFVIDGTAPSVIPEGPSSIRASERVTLRARADEDVVMLSARVGDGPPVPLRWDPAARRCVGVLTVPPTLSGRQSLFFEAMDGAGNRGFARATVEVRP